MAFDNIPKPTTTYNTISKILSFLKINSNDFLLINGSGDRLVISRDGDGNFDSIQKPSTNYDNIVKPT